MKSTDTYNDIKEVNLAYLMLAQNMVRSDREAAIFRLGISEEIADILERLTPGQVLKMASFRHAAVQLPLRRFAVDRSTGQSRA